MDRFPPRMHKVMTTALELAGRAAQDEAGVEHVLAAIVQDPSTAASFMLGEAGIAPLLLLKHSAINGDAPAPRAGDEAFLGGNARAGRRRRRGGSTR